jgi:hypothetical protein
VRIRLQHSGWRCNIYPPGQWRRGDIQRVIGPAGKTPLMVIVGAAASILT